MEEVHTSMTEQSQVSPATKTTKTRICKNFLVLAFAFFLVFTAFDTLSNLQSTMNIGEGVGTASQATIYACLMVATFFLPTVLIRKMGCKSTVVLSIVFICPYILANLFPRWETLIPAGAFSGMALGPLWAARSTYVNHLAQQYYFVQGSMSLEAINAWFFGLFSFFHENAEIWGNLISYMVFRSNESHVTSTNETLLKCGAQFCDFRSYDTNPNLIPPTDEKRYALTLTFLAIVALAVPITQIWLDPITSMSVEEEEAGEERSIIRLLTATLRHLKKVDQLLLLPLSFYVGLADGFYNTDFTKSFITCKWTISHVGLVTIAYGVVCAIMDCSCGPLVKRFSRRFVYGIGCLAHLIYFGGCLFWIPDSELPAIPYIFAGLYAVGASVWWSQIVALYGTIFQKNEEAAFSNFYFWSSLGYVIAFSYSDYVCTFVKIYVLIVLLLIGICGYSLVEIRTAKHRLKTRITQE